MAEPLKKTKQRPNAHLRAMQVGEDEYYVENAQSQLCYRVEITPQGNYCSCEEFASKEKNDPQFTCQHIRTALDQEGNIPRLDWSDKIRPKLDERFLKTIQGKDFVLYAGLLDLAHQKGLRKIQVEAFQYPNEQNGHEAICKAEIESPTGEIYIEWGDANPSNVNQKVAGHLLRMAATRAKARALRDYTNIGITCLEEIDESDEVIPEQPVRKPVSGNVVPITGAGRSKNGNGQSKDSEGKMEPESKSDENQGKPRSSDGPGPSTAQLKAIENLAKRRSITTDELEDMAQQTYGTSYRNITSTEAANFIRTLQQTN